jgi:hypothetical protein
MANKKIDGVVEAIHYRQDGSIDSLRVYVRKGAIWPDHILINRSEFIQLLEKKCHFFIGSREQYQGNTFQTSHQVFYLNGFIVTDTHNAIRDFLSGTPQI